MYKLKDDWLPQRKEGGESEKKSPNNKDFIERTLNKVDRTENYQGKLTIINDIIQNSNLTKDDEKILKQ